jgi:hypothetical protein
MKETAYGERPFQGNLKVCSGSILPWAYEGPLAAMTNLARQALSGHEASFAMTVVETFKRPTPHQDPPPSRR